MAKKSALSIEEIAAEVGRLFGTTEVHARRWLQQRRVLLEALHTVRDQATSLIDDLSGETKRQMRKRASVRIARTQVPTGSPVEMMTGRRKRRMSAATRAKMRASAKKRWAKRR